MRTLHGRKPYVPVYLGEDGRCFACGEQPQGPIEIDEPFQAPRVTVRFVVCRHCYQMGLDVDHARRTYIRKLEAWMDKLDKKHQEYLDNLKGQT